MQPEDNQAVLAFMEKSAMTVGGLELTYDRSPEFSRLLKYQSPRYYTFIGKNKAREIMGFFSITLANKWFNGEKKACGYIGDFRTDFSREAAKTWRKAYAEILRSLNKDHKLGNPQYFLTAILKKNSVAVRNLVASKKDLGFRYDFLKELDMVNIYGKFPLSSRSSIQVVKAQKSDFNELKEFIDTHERKNQFGTSFDERLQNWPDFQIENFLLVKNSVNKIIACTLPWNPSFAKRMKVTQATLSFQFTLQILRLIGFNLPQLGENLETLYLTHLVFADEQEREKIIPAFIDHLLEMKVNAHMISFPDDIGFSKSWRKYIIQRTAVLLYAVNLSESPIMPEAKNISFEMGLV